MLPPTPPRLQPGCFFERFPAGDRLKINQKPITFTGHWKATGRILGNFLWKILYTDLDLEGGHRASGGGPQPAPPL